MSAPKDEVGDATGTALATADEGRGNRPERGGGSGRRTVEVAKRLRARRGAKGVPSAWLWVTWAMRQVLLLGERRSSSSFSFRGYDHNLVASTGCDRSRVRPGRLKHRGHHCGWGGRHASNLRVRGASSFNNVPLRARRIPRRGPRQPWKFTRPLKLGGVRPFSGFFYRAARPPPSASARKRMREPRNGARGHHGGRTFLLTLSHPEVIEELRSAGYGYRDNRLCPRE